MTKNKTVMRQLLDYLEKDDRINSNANIYKKFLEEEKKQIIEAREDGFMAEVLNGRPIVSNEDYYNQRYNINV
jgi:hypothetical protein